MKKPDEIKKGLNVCGTLDGDCDNCAYAGFKVFCTDRLRQDALALIQQLEADNAEKDKRIAKLEQELKAVKRERDALYRDLSTRADACDVCKHGPLYKYDCEEEFGDCGCDFEWQGVCKENTEVQEGDH